MRLYRLAFAMRYCENNKMLIWPWVKMSLTPLCLSWIHFPLTNSVQIPATQIAIEIFAYLLSILCTTCKNPLQIEECLLCRGLNTSRVCREVGDKRSNNIGRNMMQKALTFFKHCAHQTVLISATSTTIELAFTGSQRSMNDTWCATKRSLAFCWSLMS